VRPSRPSQCTRRMDKWTKKWKIEVESGAISGH
jgi:hypothetical protein